jgi:hypothetical protein
MRSGEVGVEMWTGRGSKEAVRLSGISRVWRTMLDYLIRFLAGGIAVSPSG